MLDEGPDDDIIRDAEKWLLKEKAQAMLDLFEQDCGRTPGTLEEVREWARAQDDVFGHLRVRRTRRTGDGLCRDHPQEPGLGIPGGGHSSDDAALRHAAAQSALYRRYPGQEVGRDGWAEEGHRHRRPKRLGSPSVVEVE
jgi:hypothetical protein